MKLYRIFLMAIVATVVIASCSEDDLSVNPNAAGLTSTIPVSLILNRITNEIYYGGGVLDVSVGSQKETPWDQVSRWNQYLVSNTAYYWGSNAYTWSNSATQYGMLKYVSLMEPQIKKQFGDSPTPYTALSKFFKAYGLVWLTQRVGDIPAQEAVKTGITQPTYDTQHDVYQYSLSLLDSANTLISTFAQANPTSVLDATGDIYGLTNKQWQKVINTYTLRVLISLSKRANDNADLGIKEKFATIVNNPDKYPIMESGADNMNYKYNTSYNQYPAYASRNYNLYANVGKVFLDLTTASKDPRTFVLATPAPSLLAGGKTVADFTAYAGADPSMGQAQIVANAGAGLYSYNNFVRYFNYSDPSTGSQAEPYTILGYPELCFNIAEAANLGWLTVSSSDWYMKGINASLAVYGIAAGKVITVADKDGKTLGTVTPDVAAFLAGVAYAGDNADGRKQILQQKYVAMFQNSGYEAYYNWRRTGVPALAEGGSGIGTANSKIPVRWIYPNDEIVSNAANYKAAIDRQGFEADDVNAVMWLLK